MAFFLVTGGAGFIGSNLVRGLLARGEKVRVIDDFSTGQRANLAEVLPSIELIEGSVCDKALLRQAFEGVDYCLHQAALPSVPRSVETPLDSNRVNVEGTLHVLLAARDAGVKRVVYASSSSVYGNAQTIPIHEGLPRAPISPYGVTKAANELYAKAFAALYGMELIGLRYFNVFGPRQDPNSQYAAAIPVFIASMLSNTPPPVFGDGCQTRDFTYVENVVLANLRACEAKGPITGVYNVAYGRATSVLELVEMLNGILGTDLEPQFFPARPGEVTQSWANITMATSIFGYEPSVSVREGLERTVAWYRENK